MRRTAPSHRRDRPVGTARHARHPHPLRHRGARRSGAVGVAAPRRDDRDARVLLAVHRPRRRCGRGRYLRARRGDPPRTCDRRGRRAQDLEELRGVHRGAGSSAAGPQRGRVHRALGYARRDHGTGPRDPETAAADHEANRPRWRSGSTRRCAQGSSECLLSNCFSTSSTAKSAGPARCHRPTPNRENCVASSPSCVGRAGSCSPDPTSRTR